MDCKDLIRKIRKERGLTQIELAEKAGISVNALRLYEGGKHQPQLKQLQLLADALGVSTSALIASDDCLMDIDFKQDDIPRFRAYRMYPTKTGKAICCMVDYDNSVIFMKARNPPDATWGLSEEDAEYIEFIVDEYCLKYNANRLPLAIGMGVMTMLDMLAKESQQIKAEE